MMEKKERVEKVKVRPICSCEKIAENRTRYNSADIERIISAVLDYSWSCATLGGVTPAVATSRVSGISGVRIVYLRGVGAARVEFRCTRPHYSRELFLRIATPEALLQTCDPVAQLALGGKPRELPKDETEALIDGLVTVFKDAYTRPGVYPDAKGVSEAVRKKLGRDFSIRVNPRLTPGETARRKKRLTVEEKRVEADRVINRGRVVRRLRSLERQLVWYSEKYSDVYETLNKQKQRAIALGSDGGIIYSPSAPEELEKVVSSNLRKGKKK